MRKSAGLGVVVIILGVLFFVRQLPIGTTLWHTDWIWPVIWIVVGVFSAGSTPSYRWPWWSWVLTVYGALTLARNVGLVPMLASVDDWTILWSLVIVCFGLSLVFPNCRNGRRKSRPYSYTPRFSQIEKATNTKDSARWFHMMGQIMLGNEPWTLPRHASVFMGMGEARVNLVTALIEEGEYTLDVSGWMGSIRVLVPRGVAVSVEGGTTMGQITVFGDTHSGVVRDVTYQDSEFDQASVRIRMSVRMTMGEIDLVRV